MRACVRTCVLHSLYELFFGVVRQKARKQRFSMLNNRAKRARMHQQRAGQFVHIDSPLQAFIASKQAFIAFGCTFECDRPIKRRSCASACMKCMSACMLCVSSRATRHRRLCLRKRLQIDVFTCACASRTPQRWRQAAKVA